MANTTWNPSDKESHIALSGGNLVATGTAGFSGFARAIDQQTVGKFYWECTFAATGTLSGVGLSTLGIPVASTFSSVLPGLCGVNRLGSVFVDGNGFLTIGSIPSLSLNFGTIASGTVICIAVDFAARLVWFRLGAAGIWNNVAGRDPATGSGGISSSGTGDAYPTYPTASFGGADTITANFGGSAFTGAVPSGFTSGFTTGATSPTYDVATQSALEEFFTTNPPNQTTQVGLEMWTTTSTVSSQNIVTQVALEQWVQNPSALVPQARVMILA